MITPDLRFLLFLSHFDPGSGLPPQWVFPGGGLESDEDPNQGIVREVFEETGRLYEETHFEAFASIHHAMEDTRFYESGMAHFFELKLSEPFEPSSENWTDNEHRDTVMHRWLTVDQILSEKLWVGPDGAIDLLIERYGTPGSQPSPDQGS